MTETVIGSGIKRKKDYILKDKMRFKINNSKFIHKWLLAFAIFLLLLFISNTAKAQPQTTDQIFKQKNYAEYLTRLSDELTGIAASKSSLETVTRVAVAMEKTNGWDGEMDKKAREMMRDASDPLRYYDGVKQLLKLYPSGMDKLSQLPRLLMILKK